MGNLFFKAHQLNGENIISLSQQQQVDSFLDLGCDDGVWTQKVAKACGAREVFGVEIVDSRASEAEEKGIKVERADLAERFPYEDSSFQYIHSNQVIEHVPSVDHFASEIFRVLKPGGRAVISTENGSSWHNVFASVLGWQSFSLTNMSGLRAGVGNPLSLMRNREIEFSTWTHKVIFNYLGLLEFFELHGFKIIAVKGAGYYPLPASIGNLDPRHAHFLSVLIEKPSHSGEQS